MLIPSPRHRPEDLKLWRELEAADSIAGLSSRMERMIESSVATIIKFGEAGPCYASISWGKDSVAIAWLIAQSGVRIPCIYLDPKGYSCPESSKVRDAFLGSFDLDYQEVEIDYSTIPPDAGWEEAERIGDSIFFGAFRRFGSRYLSGIRAGESGGRRIRMRQHGLASKNACAPIGWWQTNDVFALLAAKRLPVHPNYAMLGAGRWSREHLRVDELGGRRGDQFGRREWEMEYYGDELRRLEQNKMVHEDIAGDGGHS